MIVAGIPGAGKSSLSAAQFPNARVFNPDALREKYATDLQNSSGSWDQEISEKVFKYLRDPDTKEGAVKRAMVRADRVVVLDATNVGVRDLKGWITLGKTLRPARRVHLVITDISQETARERNRLRGMTDPMREVPESVIDRFHSSLEALKKDPIMEKFSTVEVLDEEKFSTLVSAPEVSAERVATRPGRERLDEVLSRPNVADALREMARSGELQELLPEVAATIGYDQMTTYHDRELFDHLMYVVDAAEKLGGDRDVILAALLHDVGKPQSAWLCEKRHKNTPNQQIPHRHFYARWQDGNRIPGDPDQYGRYINEDHEVIGSRMAERALIDMGFEGERIRKTVTLVRYHMAKIDLEKDTPEAARRAARKLDGRTHGLVDDQLILHAADNAGHKPDANTMKLAEAELGSWRSLIVEVRQTDQQPVQKKVQLAVNGRQLQQQFGLQGQHIGLMVDALTEEVRSQQLENDERAMLRRAEQLLAQITAQPAFNKRPMSKKQRRAARG